MLVRTRRRKPNAVDRAPQGAARKRATRPEEWLLRVSTAMILVLLTAVGTLGYQCAIYLYFTGPDLIGRVEAEGLPEMRREDAEIRNWSRFTDDANQSVSSIDHTIDYLSSVMKYVRSGPGAAARAKLNSHALSDLWKINLMLGQAQGYTADGSFLTASYKEAVVGLLSADFGLWDAVFRCTDANERPRQLSSCRVIIIEGILRLQRAAATVRMQNKNNANASALRVAEITGKARELMRQNREVGHRMNLAFAGLVVSLILYYLAIRFLLLGPVSRAIAVRLEDRESNR